MLVKDFKKYINYGIVPFSVNIEKKRNNKDEYKKVITSVKWQQSTLTKPIYDKTYNSLGLKTGKESNIFVLDIDDVNEWKQILNDEEREEPITATVITGSGGLHYYFRYSEELEKIPSRSKIIGNKIDCRTNGGCIFAPPSSYYNEETKQKVCYTWKNGKSIFDYEELPKVPKWLIKLMLNTLEKDNKPKEEQPKNIKPVNIKNIRATDLLNVELEQTKIKLTNEQKNELIEMLSIERATEYSQWINVMFCLKCENNNENLEHFLTFSKKATNYNEQSAIKKWYEHDANKRNNNKLTYNTLLYYAKIDNPVKYSEYVKKNFIKGIEEETEIIIDDCLLINQPYLLKNKTGCDNNP
jgi:hypothetical protein